MKRKKLSKSILALLLVLVLAVPALAEEPEGEELHITSAEEFMTFAGACRLDSYSRNLAVYLDADLDLSGKSFTGIPIFCGTFYGNSHRISGLDLSGDGSVQGFFRYISAEGTVQDLTVQGDVLPGGSHSTVGGLVGSNAGVIQNCIFDGSVSGSDRVGGLAGINAVSGIIENCSVYGSLHGDHFAGGVVGENSGLIRACKNDAQVNITEKENDVKLSDISMETLLGTESAKTVTDIGGIAGTSTGVIRDCENNGNVGYLHMGYNVGGIAGSQRGYIAGCRNTGDIFGRKEVGGIVGQMEPISKIEYTDDTLQILQQQLSGTSALASRASANAMNSAADLGAQLSAMEDQSKNAQDAIKQLIPSEENPQLPDADSVLAAKNTLDSSMTAMQDSLRSISRSSQDALNTTARDIEAISGQINAMGNTLSNASENMGGTVADVSDQDSPEDMTGKVESCRNEGAVSGDLNAGGIAGAVGRENDLDPEDDFQITGDRSMNFNSQLRSVISGCHNSGSVSGKKRNVGGIVGSMSLGLTKESVNTGFVDGGEGQYVGGIAGTSSGFIRGCSAKCRLVGESYVGGIAGSGAVVTDCRSMTRIQDGRENLGAVLGGTEECSEAQESPFLNNTYLAAEEDRGGIDGVSYEGIAQPLSADSFFALDNLESVFRQSLVTFRFADGTRKVFEVFPGDSISPEEVPELPAKEGCNASWKEFTPRELEEIYFDKTFIAEYTPCYTAVASAETRENGMPVVLAEGQFQNEDAFPLTALEQTPQTAQGGTVLESWEVPVLSDYPVTRLRICVPEGEKAKNLTVQVLHQDGSWSQTETAVDGSYLVFPVQESDTGFSLLCSEDSPLWMVYTGVALIAALVIGGLLIQKRSKKKKAAKTKKA